ncbi:hypothetical protein ALC60_06244 [Trachymyrmex zeteki]|uniref:Uncharacterized protein n=1 Tax=Mycetomoellerius zeteki TaxID=64791 RepID=A0A151X3B9_9HYME|nr:hypothetical protein ALC60_06244 [Trachymyrmex zeteki]
MHSTLIALSASRIYTLLRTEPLKKPSFTLPLERRRGMMKNMSAKTSRRIRRYIGNDGGRQREKRQDKGTTKGNPVAYKGG